jgi:hypothetical protein
VPWAASPQSLGQSSTRAHSSASAGTYATACQSLESARSVLRVCVRYSAEWHSLSSTATHPIVSLIQRAARTPLSLCVLRTVGCAYECSPVMCATRLVPWPRWPPRLVLAIVVVEALKPVQRALPRNVFRLLRQQKLRVYSSSHAQSCSIFCSHVRTWLPICLQSLVSRALCRQSQPCALMLNSRQWPPMSWRVERYVHACNGTQLCVAGSISGY